MPAPDHLVPILDRLGDGGTVDLAERVHQMIQEARASGPVPAANPDGSVTVSQDRADIADLAAILIGELGATTTSPDERTCQLAARVLREQAAELDQVRGLFAEVESSGTAQRTAQEALRAARQDAQEKLKDVQGKLAALADYTPRPGEEVIITVAARLDEDGYYTWDGEGGIKQDDVLSVHPAVSPDGDRAPTASDAQAPADADTCTTCGQPLDSPPCIPTPDGAGGHTTGAGVMAATDGDDIDWDDDELAADAPNSGADAPNDLRTQDDGKHPEPTSQEIRTWCVEHGVPVNAKGRISDAARSAYDDAHREA